MLRRFGMAHRLEELPLYEKIQEFWSAVFAILQRSALRRDRDLWEQISDANDSIDANMHEGFGQPTDASFANYVFIAKNSLAEVVARVNKAHQKGHISDDDLRGIRQLGEPPGR
jgi:four helix bundle protein